MLSPAPSPTSLANVDGVAQGYLRQLPALTLLGRMPIPVLGISSDGSLVYANQALLKLLGYSDFHQLRGRPMSEITQDIGCASPRDQLESLRSSAGMITSWKHAAGHSIKAIVSEPLLMRVFDPLLLVNLTDVTDCLGELGTGASADRPLVMT